jgi:hypothetical protein
VHVATLFIPSLFSRIVSEPKEQVKSDVHVVRTTPYQRSANVNNASVSGENIFVNFRRAEVNADCNTLAVVEICVIVTSKVRLRS